MNDAPYAAARAAGSPASRRAMHIAAPGFHGAPVDSEPMTARKPVILHRDGTGLGSTFTVQQWILDIQAAQARQRAEYYAMLNAANAANAAKAAASASTSVVQQPVISTLITEQVGPNAYKAVGSVVDAPYIAPDGSPITIAPQETAIEVVPAVLPSISGYTVVPSAPTPVPDVNEPSTVPVSVPIPGTVVTDTPVVIPATASTPATVEPQQAGWGGSGGLMGIASALLLIFMVAGSKKRNRKRR